MDKDLDTLIEEATSATRPVNPDLLDRINRSIGPAIPPVSPIPAPWILATGLIGICVSAAFLGAATLGFAGVEKLTGSQRVLIFPLLTALILLSSASCVAEMIPGSRRQFSPGTLLGVGTLVVLAVFAILFRDYQTHRFVSQGVACLTAGLADALPVAIGSWLLMRRGFAVNPSAAGLVAGTLAGLTGLTMLELHCPNFEALHVMLWHVAVVGVSGGAGAWLGTQAKS